MNNSAIVRSGQCSTGFTPHSAEPESLSEPGCDGATGAGLQTHTTPRMLAQDHLPLTLQKVGTTLKGQ